MHDWSDETFDWNSLNDARRYIKDNCRRWARLGVHIKEKWGVLRLNTTYAYWGEWPLHNLFKPGHYHYRWLRWINYIEYPLSWIFRTIYLTRGINLYQSAVLRFFWKRAARKWPHISKEILADYNWTVWRR